MALQYNEEHPIIRDIPIASTAKSSEALAEVFGKVGQKIEETTVDMQKEASHSMFLQAQSQLDDLETKSTELMMQNPGNGAQIALKAKESAKSISNNTMMNRSDRENFNYLSTKSMNNLEQKGVQHAVQLNRETEKFRYISSFTRENLPSYQQSLLSDPKAADILEEAMLGTIQDKVMRGVLTAVEGAHLVQQIHQKQDNVRAYLQAINEGRATSEHAVAYASTLPSSQTDLAKLPSNETTMQLKNIASEHMSIGQIESNITKGNYVNPNAIINLNSINSVQKVTQFQMGAHMGVGLFNSNENYAVIKAEQKRLANIKYPSDFERGKAATLTNMVNEMEKGDGFLNLLSKSPEGARIAQENHMRAEAINAEPISNEEKKGLLLNLRDETMSQYSALGIAQNIPDRYHRLLPKEEIDSIESNLFAGGNPADAITELSSFSPKNRNSIAASMPGVQKQVSTYIIANSIGKTDKGFIDNFSMAQQDKLQFTDEFQKQSSSIKTKIQTKLWDDNTFKNITSYLSIFPPGEGDTQTAKGAFVKAAQNYVMLRAAQKNDHNLDHVSDYQAEFMSNISRIFPIEKGDNYTVNKNDIDPALSKQNYQLLAKYAIDLVRQQKFAHMSQAEEAEAMLQNPMQMISTQSGQLVVVDSHNKVVTDNDGHELFQHYYMSGMLHMAEHYEKLKGDSEVSLSSGGEADSNFFNINQSHNENEEKKSLNNGSNIASSVIDAIIPSAHADTLPEKHDYQDAIELVKKNEDFISVARDIGDGKITGGYGDTHSYKEGQKVDRKKAEDFVAAHIKNVVDPGIRKSIKVPLTANQLTALRSASYVSGHVPSNVAAHINKGDFSHFEEDMLDYYEAVIKAHPEREKFWNGWVNRTKREAKLFYKK